MSYTHLQIKSGYSLMESTLTIEKLVKRAKELQFKSLALTDEHVLYGVIPFYKACIKHGIKPIIGMTVHIENTEGFQETCILLAENNQGYEQLIKLSSLLNTEEKNFIEKENLHLYTDGLTGILPVMQSSFKEQFRTVSFEQIQEEVKVWANLFNQGSFYLGIQDHGTREERELQQQMKAFHDITRIPVVAVNDVRYLNEGDARAFECLQAMKKNQKWSGQEEISAYRQNHLRSSVEMEQLFGSFWPEVLSETERIAENCTVTIDFTKRMLPSYPVPKGQTAHAYLKKLCHEHIVTRYQTVSKKAFDRLNYELNIIESMNFSDYFLIVWDFINYAKTNKILVGPGRGSSAGSLVAYVLGITEVDPLKHDLLFERFLNPERVTMPDIDVDFSDHRRDEVIDYVKNKYGEEHVAQIITFGTFAARSLVRELIKTMGINQQDADYILRSIPVQSGKTLLTIIDANKELQQYIKQSVPLKQLFSIALKLEGLPRHVSTHAAGVVISDAPLIEHVPLTKGANMHLTQYPMDDLEAIGLLKMDFLGLRNLTLLEQIVHSIERSENKQIVLNQLPVSDVKTFDLLQKGKTNGVFQLESSGMKQVLTRLRPTEFEDIVAVNALYRPGPMDFIQTYIDRKHGLEKVTYPHPDLEHILAETYGVLIYQEQIMQIAHQIAGYSLGQADILRRAVSKKQYHLMQEQKTAFIKGCLNHGYDEAVGERLFAWIVKFSDYGFPKSHAAAYSKISYQLAYLKTHYPKNFYAELLSTAGGHHEKIRLYINEMKDHSISLLPPSINKSFGRYSVENQGVRMGLISIKGIGGQVTKEIIEVRKEGPFKSLFDFCMRVSLQVINRTSLEQLILSGAFDELYHNRASLLASIDLAMEQATLFREFRGMSDLFQGELKLENTYVDIEDFHPMKKLTDEKEHVGVYLSAHPLSEYRNQLRANGYLSLSHASRLLGKRNIRSAASILEIRTIRTKRGDPMAFITLGDEKSELEGVVFPDLFRKTKQWLNENMLVFLRGNIETRNDRVQMLLQEITPFDVTNLQDTSDHRLFIQLVDQKSDEALQVIKKLAHQFPGKTPILVYHQQTNRTYQLSSEFFINPTHDCLQAFNQSFSRENIVLENR